MKISQLFIYAAGLALTAVATVAAESAEQWLNRYYENPQPERFEAAVHELSRSGFFERPGNVPLAIGFFAGVFRQNPEQVDLWVMNTRGLPRAHQRLVAAALWYSGHRRGREYLQAYAQVVGPGMRGEIERLLAMEPVLRDTPVCSASSLNLQWGAFLATGEAQHIRNVLAALGSDEPALGAKVRLALAEKAASHERVYEICQTELERQSAEVRERMNTAMAAAKAQ
ncbi:MAG TPA: hypothetical protein VG734_24730 [Lacunisphaera sp.]|nr:hypothetical protein [Lacunisphaera sp.]